MSLRVNSRVVRQPISMTRPRIVPPISTQSPILNGASKPRATPARTLRIAKPRCAYDGAKHKNGSKLHLAVDTLGHLLTLHVTPANADDRAEVSRIARDIQSATGQSVEVAFVDQGHTGDRAATAAAEHGIALEVIKLSEAKRGLGLLPRRWVVERSFA